MPDWPFSCGFSSGSRSPQPEDRLSPDRSFWHEPDKIGGFYMPIPVYRFFPQFLSIRPFFDPGRLRESFVFDFYPVR
jgi:hypothetical protein